MRNLLIVFLSALCVIACNNEQIVFSYVVVKPTVEDSVVNEWRPVMKVAYRVGENTVISEVANLLDEYKNCSIKDKNNWQCQYEDGTGKNKFGFNEGGLLESARFG